MYLTSIDDATLHQALVQSLRTHRKPGAPVLIDRSQLVYTTVQNLASGLSWAAQAGEVAKKLDDAYNGGESPRSSNFAEMEDVARIEAVLWALITAGVVYPRFQYGNGYQPAQYPLVIKYFVLTKVGEHYLDENTLHPCAPDFITNATSGLCDLPSEVRAALEDAQLCFQHRLLRASVVQLGIAYEAMASEVYDVIVGGNKPRDAVKVLEKIKHAVERLNNVTASQAVIVAEHIRTVRNTAAHSWRHDFRNVGEVEALLILSGRNVAPFWNLRSG